MSADGVAARRIDDLPQLWDGFAKLVREGMGISAFGVQIMDLPPDYRTKSHDESDTGQEELYIALRGSGAVVIKRATGCSGSVVAAFSVQTKPSGITWYQPLLQPSRPSTSAPR